MTTPFLARALWKLQTGPWVLALGVLTSALLLLAGPDVAPAATCTRGVDCYCDKVKAGGPLADANLLFCEDWEAPTLHDNTPIGGGSPNFGPWYDDTGLPGGRGNNSYWTQKFGAVTGTCAWSGGQPASPTVGLTCAFGTCFAGEWRLDNLWQANTFACIDIVRAGEFNDEIATNAEPTNAAGGGTGPFDGIQSFGHRIPPGLTFAGSGVGGGPSWSPTRTNVGITMAVAYASNTTASGIWDSPWKHNEWGSGIGDGWFLFHNSPCGNTQCDNDPFQHFIFLGSVSAAQCNARIAAANVRRGVLTCAGDVALYYRPEPAYYRQSVDWPAASWACVRGHMSGMGTANLSVKIWFRGPNDSGERLIIDFDGFNGQGLANAGGYDSYFWDSYANANGGSGTPTTQPTYRYEDNIHIRAGVPVSCTQIGFPAAGIPPAAPSGLIAQ